MMELIYNLETVKPQEIPIKYCVMFYDIEICYRGCGKKKQVILELFDISKCIVVGLLMVEEVFSLLFYCESIINQYAGHKTLGDVLRASLLLPDLGCFRDMVLPYYLRMLLRVFMRR